MNYRTNPLNGDRLSILGFGCMRFPADEKETEALVLHAIEQGVNYFDTAYIYGNSEATLGRILDRNGRRADVKIATKIQPALIRKAADLDHYFNRQLARLRTDYIDYYFIHMITDVNVWKRLTELGVERWIEEKKAAGRIKNIGFSYHGGRDEFIKICDCYPWEFCMIQYNYLDENNQAGRAGLRYAAGKGMPVMIMEPLRGGILANKLPRDALRAFGQSPRSPAEWSFRWLWDQPEITCVVSGMNGTEMLRENIATASTAEVGAFTQEDFDVIARAKQALTEAVKVPCTGCGYCMPCPRGVDIPTCLSCYNNTVIEGKRRAVLRYFMQTTLKAKPQIASLCNRCGHCEKNCPQGIAIREELRHTARALEKFWFKPVLAVARRFFRLS